MKHKVNSKFYVVEFTKELRDSIQIQLHLRNHLRNISPKTIKNILIGTTKP